MRRGPVTLTYVFGPNGSWLMAEVSLPRLIHGHNVYDLTLKECTSALAILVDAASSECPGLGIDASTAAINRVDFVRTWAVPDPGEYLRTLQMVLVGAGWTRSYVKKRLDGGLGLEEGGKTRNRRLYDKGTETAHACRRGHLKCRPAGEREFLLGEAKGKVRYEDSVRQKALHRTVLKKHGSTIAGLLQYLAEEGVSSMDRAIRDLGHPTCLDPGSFDVANKGVAALRQEALRQYVLAQGMDAVVDRFGLNPRQARQIRKAIF